MPHIARAEGLQLPSAEQHWSKGTIAGYAREPIGSFCVFKVVLRFNMTCRALLKSFTQRAKQVIARAEELQLPSAEQYRSKDSETDTTRESIGTFGAFFVSVRFNTSVRSQIRSEQIVISISLLNLHEVSARAH